MAMTRTDSPMSRFAYEELKSNASVEIAEDVEPARPRHLFAGMSGLELAAANRRRRRSTPHADDVAGVNGSLTLNRLPGGENRHLISWLRFEGESTPISAAGVVGGAWTYEDEEGGRS